MVKKTKLQLKKVQFTNEITPILNTLDFEYKDPNTDSMYRKELYSYINGKYYYIKKDYAECYDKTKNYIEYRFCRQDTPYTSYNSYHNGIIEKCFLRLDPKTLGKYLIYYYVNCPLIRNRCVFCPKIYCNKHSIKTKTHLKNRDNFINEISIISKLKMDCINHIFSYAGF
jgi:hypothetical protein